MSNIDKQALRLTAEKAKDNFIPNLMVPTRDVLTLLDELEAAEKRIAELESRPVKLPEGYATRLGHPINEGERGVMIPKEGGRWLSRFDVEHALRVAGITVKGE